MDGTADKDEGRRQRELPAWKGKRTLSQTVKLRVIAETDSWRAFHSALVDGV